MYKSLLKKKIGFYFIFYISKALDFFSIQIFIYFFLFRFSYTDILIFLFFPTHY
ncbi:hypothetical protein C1646_678889, partial [Rhizophagus diaphanus]